MSTDTSRPVFKTVNPATLESGRSYEGHSDREAEHLPERKVPRHHRQHDPERVERHEGVGAVDRDLRARQVVGRAIGEVLAGRGALVDLGPAVGDRLAHLVGHQRRQRIAPLAQDGGRRAHALGAGAEIDAPP
jgi:hypothetical protein